jgi:hypothetical protein
VKVVGRWRYVYRTIDQFGQVIDVFVSVRRNARAARRFFGQAIGTTKVRPVEVVSDHAPVYPAVLEELLPAAWHRTEQYATTVSKQITAEAVARGDRSMQQCRPASCPAARLGGLGQYRRRHATGPSTDDAPREHLQRVVGMNGEPHRRQRSRGHYGLLVGSWSGMSLRTSRMRMIWSASRIWRHRSGSAVKGPSSRSSLVMRYLSVL